MRRGRPRRPASAGCERRRAHEHSYRPRPALSRRRRPQRHARRGVRPRRDARSASCSSPPPIAGCCGSRSTRIRHAELERIERLAGRRVLRSSASVDNVHRELDEYFEGRRHAFDLAVDLRGLTPFSERVLHELARVPFGETATYAGLAERAGKPKAARAVGTIMNRNPVPIVLPCHRIIGAERQPRRLRRRARPQGGAAHARGRPALTVAAQAGRRHRRGEERQGLRRRG